MTVMIIGASGQLGSRLVEIIEDGIPVYHRATEKNQIALDVGDPLTLEDLILKKRPDTIVNASAFADVEGCETDKEKAFKVNAMSVKHIVRAARVVGSYFIHVSTDYVFDGMEGNYSENSIPNPINYYGTSKLIGDSFALSYDESLIVRTSGVFGIKNNFPKFAYDRLANNEKLPVIDATYSPIHAALLARAISELVPLRLTGILNVAGDPVSRLNFARKMCEMFEFNEANIVQKDAKDMNWKARRPDDSSLDIGKSKRMINFDFHSVESNLKELLNRY